LAYLLKGADLICPGKKEIFTGDILIEETLLSSIGKEIDPPEDSTEVIDCKGLQVFPGFFDMHVHFRDPGQTHKEDLFSGLQAAAAGGFTGVAAMANTTPVIDNPNLVSKILEKGKELGGPSYHQIPAATFGLTGKELTDFSGLLSAGAVAFSDDGQPIWDQGLLNEILQASSELGFVYIEHCEDQNYEPEDLASEVNMVYRDIECLIKRGGNLHLAHISCAKSLELVIEGKKEGLNLTCEVTPHHLALDYRIIKEKGTNARMNPPLRKPEDVIALREGVAEGYVDAIATDHAPHTKREKDVPYNKAPRGVVGLETAVGVIWKELHHGMKVSPLLLGQVLSENPRRILGLPVQELKEGAKADLTLVDPVKEWVVDPEGFYSRGKNSPFSGERLKGKPAFVFKDGMKIMEKGRVLSPAGRN